MATDTKTTTISWIALIIAIVALILGWTAFNRAGQDVLPTVEQETQEAVRTVQIRAALLEARLELLALRARLVAEENVDEIATEINEIQAELQAEAVELQIETRQEIREIDQEFEQVEQAVRTNSADALQRFNNLLERLQRDIRTDE